MSDWSSDVCSSDLPYSAPLPGVALRTTAPTGLVSQKEPEPSRISPWGRMRRAGRHRHTPGMVAPPDSDGARSRAAHIALVLFVGLYIVVFLLKLLSLAEIPSGDSALVNVAVYGTLLLLGAVAFHRELARAIRQVVTRREDRKSTRLNSSHSSISYAVFCLKKKRK